MTEQAPPARRERNTVLAALELFRATGASRVFYTMLLFLYVCENEGLTVSELAYVARMHVTTTARLVKAMAGEGRAQDADADGGGDGFEAPLLEVRASADDHRLKFIHLSAAGRALRGHVGALIRAAVPIED
jgi:DNA-binding MarR family transcriptional regulator